MEANLMTGEKANFMIDTENKTMTRCVTMTVLKPVGAEWSHFGKALDIALARAARCANIVQGALYLADRQAAVASPKLLPPIAWPSTYREAVNAAPELPTSTVSMIDQYVRKKYKSRNSDGLSYRYAAFSGRGSVPSYRGMPYPVHRREWVGSLSVDGDGNLIVPIPLARSPVEGRQNQKVQHWTVMLKSMGNRGGEVWQADAMRKVMRGELDAGELKIFRSGGRGVVRVSFAVRFPLPAESQDTGKLTVRTCADKLFEVTVEGRERLWQYHGHPILRSMAAARMIQQNLSDDYKFEPRSVCGGSREAMSERARKHQQQAKAHLNRASWYLVEFAKRQKCGKINYDDRERGWMQSGPWSMLATMIQNKCEQYGIGFNRIEENHEPE